MQTHLTGKHCGRRFFLLASLMLLAGAVSYAQAEPPGGLPPQSHAFGKPLSEWFQLYWAQVLWSDVGVEMPDQVGNVKFLPIPEGNFAGGTGTVDDPAILVGHLDVTLSPGTGFVLPVAGWAGWLYEDGSEDPQLDPSAMYGTVEVDGKPITLGYIEPVYFDDPIPLPEGSGGVATTYVQGLVFAHQPLSVGTHTITLVSGFELLDWDLGVQFQNTWTITVEP